MNKTMIAATAAALLASVTFGVAASGGAPQGPRAGDHPRISQEQMAEHASAMSDARIAALKAGLRLNPDQEKLWPALEKALRASADERLEARKGWREQRAERRSRNERPDPVAGLSERADNLVERGEALKTLAAAAGPLYQSLDEAQKHRFAPLFRAARGERSLAFHQRGPRHGGKPGWEKAGWHREGGPGRPGPGTGHHPAPAPQGERL